MIQEIFCYILLGLFPIFQSSCYVVLWQTKDDMITRKRDVTMIVISTVASWLAYINFISSLFGGIHCGVYHIFLILLPPFSVGSQLLRGIKLWGMLEYNKILRQSYVDVEDHFICPFDSTTSSVLSKSGSNLNVINDTNSSLENSNSSEVRLHINRRRSANDKTKEIKLKVHNMLGLTRLLLVVIPITLICALLSLTDTGKLNHKIFFECFPEPPFVLNAGRLSIGIFSLAAFCCTILLSRCHDELGIRKEIVRNLVILFVTNVIALVCRFNDLFKWQAFVYLIQQIVVAFSMIIMPNTNSIRVVAWVRHRSKRLIPGYAGPRPQLHQSRSSLLHTSSKKSQYDQKESDRREREITMSLDAGLCILLSSSEGIEAFTDHCSREFSVENIKFWIEVNEFHKAIDLLRNVEGNSSRHDENDVFTFAKEIYETFIEPGAAMQINISESQSAAIKEGLASKEAISRNLFDAAQTEIYGLMSQHSYPRFLSSRSNKNYKRKMTEKRASNSQRRNSTVHPG